MPAIIVAIVTWISTTLGVSMATAGMILSIGASLVLGEVSKLFRKSPSFSSLSSQLASRTVTTRQPVSPWKVAYGSNRMGGIITFLHTTGANNEFLQLVITLTGHEVSAIPAMYFDGVQVPLDGSGNATGNFAGFVHAEFNLGAKDQAAFPGLVTAAPTYWTSAYRQRGRAGVYVQLKWDQNKFPNGVPNITFDVSGRKVYDPRSGAIAYSSNAALCIADYLNNASFGLVAQTKAALVPGTLSQSGLGAFNAANCVDGDITTAGWNTDAAVPNANLQVDLGASATAEYRRCRIYAAANLYAGIYDVQYSDNGSTWTAAATGFKPNVIGWNEVELAPNGAHRYWRLNLTNTPGATGTLNELEFYTSDVDSTQLIAAANTCDEAVALAAGGTENRFTINGSFGTDEKPADVIGRMNSAMAGSVVYLAGKWGIYPGIWRAPTVTLSDADFRGPFTVQTRMAHRDLYNGVKGTFISPTNKWQISDYPPLQSAAYLQEDNNEPLWLDVELPFTTSGATAQRLSKIALRRARRQITVQGQFKLTAYQVQPLDAVQLSHPRFGWTNKTFEVAACSLVYAPDNQAKGSALAVGVDLTLRETDSTVYDWTTADEVQLNAPPTTVLPQNTVCQPPTSLNASTAEIIRVVDGVRTSYIGLTWTAPADQFVLSGGHIIVQYKKHTDTNWTDIGKLKGSVVAAQIGPVVDGTLYDIQMWAENSSGVTSSVVTGAATPTGTSVTFSSSTVLNPQGNIPATALPSGWLNIYKKQVQGSVWAASTAYAVGDLVRFTISGQTQRCIVAGISGGAAPSAPASNWGTVTDNTVTWRRVGAGTSTASYGMVKFAWAAITPSRADGSTLSIPASSAEAVPSAPTLSQVAGGTLAARTRYARVALVKNGFMHGISSESSLAVSLNNLLQIASPASVTGYDGWVPLVGPDANCEQLAVDGAISIDAPVAFGTNYTEPAAGFESLSLKPNLWSDDNGLAASQGIRRWAGTNSELAASTTYFYYPAWSLALSLVHMANIGLKAAGDVVSAAKQSGDGNVALSAGSVQVAQPAAGGAGSGTDGGAGGGRGTM